MSLLRRMFGFNVAIRPKVWDASVIIVAAGAIAWMAIASVLPSSLWLEVRSVYVSDTVAGDVPLMQVDRTIHADVRGEYRVEVQRFERGGWLNICAGEGRANYHHDAVLPDPLTLDWWTYPATCSPSLTPGRYRIETRWTLFPDIAPPREVRVLSNIFTVSPPIVVPTE